MSHSLRDSRLHAFDACSRDYIHEARALAEGGEGLASREVDILCDLADQVVRSLRLWRDRLDKLDFAAREPLSVPLAARLLTEVLFDEVLEPSATRVFAAAVDIAL
jgi:hypothetical protein